MEEDEVVGETTVPSAVDDSSAVEEQEVEVERPEDEVKMEPEARPRL